MNRWAVRKLHPHVCGPDGTAWVAGEVGKWQNTACSFRTWCEALDYADRMARTIEVTLPRITGDMEDGMSGWTNLRDVGLSVDHHDEPRLGQPYVMIYDGYSDIGVEAYDLKPLALALLALGFKETQ